MSAAGGRLAWLAAVLILAALPLWLGSYGLTLFIFIFFYAFLGQAWNLVGGYAGQLSAGHAAFVGLGAYTSAMLSTEANVTPWVGMFVGALLTALLGAVIGFLGFRFGLRGFYFVLLTVAFAEICRIAADTLGAQAPWCTEVAVRVGHDSGLEPANLQFCLEALLTQPPFVGARATILEGVGDELRVDYLEVDDDRSGH